LAGENFTVEEVRDAAYLPESLPPVTAVFIADDSNVWVGREAIPDSPTEWDVLSPKGELIGRVLAPADFDLRIVAQDHAWGIVQDELDVPYVVRRPLVRP
jgi:hypothetical protein